MSPYDKTQTPTKDSGEDSRKGQGHHRPKVGSRPAHPWVGRFHGDR
jgi:hypothetical protein